MESKRHHPSPQAPAEKRLPWLFRYNVCSPPALAVAFIAVVVDDDDDVVVVMAAILSLQ